MIDKIPGTIKVECTQLLKQEMKKGGVEGCVLILDEIKDMDNVADVWFADDKKTDIVVEISINDVAEAEALTTKIKALAGVENVQLRVAVEA